MRRGLWSVILLGMLFCYSAFTDVVINEISYNPQDDQYISGSLREFVELYNPGNAALDLSGYQFTKGITFTFPAGTSIAAGGYLVVVRDLKQTLFRGNRFPVIGTYEGELANSGERLEIVRPDGTVADSVRYNDRFPWSVTADGYGPTLERIAWDLPSDDFHSWRASMWADGTPGAVNSVITAVPRPMIAGNEVIPPYPTSHDSVTIRAGLDAASVIDSVTLQWEIPQQGSLVDNTQPAMLVLGYDRFRYWKGKTAPSEGEEWAKPEFDDSAWPQGQGMHGYGISDMIGTRLSDMKGNYTSVYARRTFQISKADTLKNVDLYAFFTAGFICYLNGVEVARANVPQSATYATLATRSHPINTPELYRIENANGLLQTGNNTIAFVGFTNNISQNSFGTGVFLLEGERSGVAGEVQVYSVRMSRVAGNVNTATYEAQIPPQPSQTLVRFNVRLKRTDGAMVTLPYLTELRPFESYYVYDGEIESKLPILWPYYTGDSQLPEAKRSVSGVVILPTGEMHPQVFDGALLYPSRNGQKLKFLKGEEYRNDRTLNILPERPQGGTTAGPSTPHREDLGFWFFREFGIPSCRTDWFRIIANGQHTQQLLIQQVNEKFLEMNGLNPEADLFKRNYVSPNWEPHNNLENGTQSIDALCRGIRLSSQDPLHEFLTANLDMEEFLAYVTASVLSSNWDGFHNNHWMYLDPETKVWQIIPWDLDKAWGYTDTNSMFVAMPIEFPLNGRAQHAARETGPVTGWLMKDTLFYQQYIDRLAYEMNHAFTEERMFAQIDAIEQFLLDDLQLLEKEIGAKRDDRRSQIVESYETIRTFVRLRRDYLKLFLPTPVSDWSVY